MAAGETSDMAGSVALRGPLPIVLLLGDCPGENAISAESVLVGNAKDGERAQAAPIAKAETAAAVICDAAAVRQRRWLLRIPKYSANTQPSK